MTTLAPEPRTLNPEPSPIILRAFRMELAALNREIADVEAETRMKHQQALASGHVLNRLQLRRDALLADAQERFATSGDHKGFDALLRDLSLSPTLPLSHSPAQAEEEDPERWDGLS